MSCLFLRSYLFCSLFMIAGIGFAHAQAVAEIDPELAIPATDEGQPGAGPIHRGDWFQEVWNSRRDAWAEQVEQDQGALVFLGDSITQGWGDDFQGAFEGAKLANRGISGDTTRGMLIRLEKDVIALNPSGVVMLMGTNDIGDKASAETIAGNVKLIIAALKKHNSSLPIVLCLVMPSSAEKDRPADKIRELNKKYIELAKGDKQVTVLDLYTLFANEEGDAKLAEFPDLLHPNKTGYAKWAGALRPVLVKLDLLEVEADNLKP